MYLHGVGWAKGYLLDAHAATHELYYEPDACTTKGGVADAANKFSFPLLLGTFNRTLQTL
jgi:hypothetical protein